MTDKRRKRHATRSGCDDNIKDCHVVNIGEPFPPLRRHSHSNARAESSWMAKVTTVMSQRIFSGKKLSGSRSTQVMPMESSKEVAKTGMTTITMSCYDELPLSKQCRSSLRQVSSENSLPTAEPTNRSSSANSGSVINDHEECPVVICNISPDDDDDDESTRQNKQLDAAKGMIKKVYVRATQRKSGLEAKHLDKVAPRRECEEDDSDDNVQGTFEQRKNTIPSFKPQNSTNPKHKNDDAMVASIQDTTPILKDFFSRNAATGQKLRTQKRELRRETLYKTFRQRQDKLREQVELEQEQRMAQLQKHKINQLRKQNQQRRVNMRLEAASARRELLCRLQSDDERYLQEREQWENAFQDEMDALSRAFRKASARIQQNDDNDRPMTVAGLAVPVALSQIQREGSNYEKRLKTAPASCKRKTAAVSECMDRKPSSNDGSYDIFRLEDSDKVYDDFQIDDEVNLLVDDGKDVIITDLMNERECLLKRIAKMEQLVLTQAKDHNSSLEEKTQAHHIT